MKIEPKMSAVKGNATSSSLQSISSTSFCVSFFSAHKHITNKQILLNRISTDSMLRADVKMLHIVFTCEIVCHVYSTTKHALLFIIQIQSTYYTLNFKHHPAFEIYRLIHERIEHSNRYAYGSDVVWVRLR